MAAPFIEYPALIYTTKRHSRDMYVANCIIKKLVGYGRTEKDAVSNLEAVLNKLSTEYAVKVKPVYRFMSMAN